MSDVQITYDVIIIGAGHNGLVAAAYLAKARRKVLVLEARDVVGGMASTEELWPEHFVSRVAHVYTGLHPRIVKDLKLHRHGLKLSARRMATIGLGDNGDMVIFSPDRRHGRGPALGLNGADMKAYERFLRRMKAVSTLASELGGNPVSAKTETELALRQALRRLDEDAASDAVRLAFTSPGEVLSEIFESPLVQGILCVDALLGGSGGPFDGGQMPAWCWRLGGEVSGTRMALGLAAGGMGSISSALAAAAQEAGATIQLGARVAEIITDTQTAYAVKTEDGHELGARAIVSAMAPRDTLLRLVGARALEPSTLQTLAHAPHKGHIARLTLGLSALPNFRGIPDDSYLKSRVVIAPSLEYLAQAWNAAKRGEPAEHPAFEITIPTTHEPALAPGTKQILCANVLFAPYDVNGGWEARKEQYHSHLLDALGHYIPRLRDYIIHTDLLTPPEIEAEFGCQGGHWHHAPLSFDNILGLRPSARAADLGPYPDNLYFASAGAHPGGGVTGVPGMLCARRLLEDMED